MFVFLAALGVIYYITKEYGMEAGGFAVLAAIGLLMIGLICSGHQQNKAYGNAVRYWAKGGPDRYRRR